MRSTFWPNRIFERQSCQNRHTGLKFSSKRGNSALLMKIVQNARFRSCAGGFAQIVFFEGQTSQTRYTCLKFSPKREHSALFMKIVQNALFRSCAAPFWPNRFLERQSCQNRHTGQKLFSKRENRALSMKIVQNALFRSCAARFGQIAFLSVKVVQIVTLASNSLQNGETVRFSWKLYKTLVSGDTQHVLAKSHFRASKLSKSSHWPQILSKTGKECAFHENCTKRLV